MNITWLGHSCFVVESAGWRIVLDPYYVETYPALHIEADEALCSHGHRDHAFLEAVTLSGRDKSESPFTVETVSTFHDDKKGSLRGENTIHILRAEGVTLVHCGDLGHELNEKQLAAVKGCDALLYFVSYRLLTDGALRGGAMQLIGFVLLWALLFAFVWFTYRPLHLPLFLDPVSGCYGLETPC